MEPMKSEDAVARLICPYIKTPGIKANPGEWASTSIVTSCFGRNCVAWKVVERQISREDHSGARDYLRRIIHEENRRYVEIESGNGKVWLPERGICNYFQRL